MTPGVRKPKFATLPHRALGGIKQQSFPGFMRGMPATAPNKGIPKAGKKLTLKRGQPTIRAIAPTPTGGGFVARGMPGVGKR